jgi:hypothetical protein
MMKGKVETIEGIEARGTIDDISIGETIEGVEARS